MSEPTSQTLEQLLAAEREDLGLTSKLDSAAIQHGPSGEPRVARLQDDLVGLALSGGGIRSATFALGLLQSLHRFGLLQSVHYLSTVSGGGYIGSWWTAWRYRRRKAENVACREKHFFPDSGDSANPDKVEHSAVRHVREFSNFLVPRIGLFEVETWSAVVVLLGSLLPSLVIAAAVIVSVEVSWLALAAWGRMVVAGFWITFVATGLAFFFLEGWQWSNRRKHGRPAGSWVCFILLAAIAMAGAACIHAWLAGQYGSSSPGVAAQAESLWELLRRLFDAAPAVKPNWHAHPYLYWGALACLGTAAGGFVLRLLLLALPCRCAAAIVEPPLERVVMRLLGLGVFGLILGLIWEVGFNLRGENAKLVAASLTAGGSAGVFALLRNWWQQVGTASRSQGWTAALRPYVGMALAYVAVGLLAIVTAALLPAQPVELKSDSWGWSWTASCTWTWPWDWPTLWTSDWTWRITGIAMVIVVSSLFLPLEEFGLHDLYRRRLARAYLGASHPEQVDKDFEGHAVNRQTDLRQGDDVRLACLNVGGGGPPGAGRPLHLICCAANDVAGDPVVNLGRGARSAVLSPHGLSIGNAWSERPDLLLSSAMTASAAAFNSQMGQKSRKLGPAVAFLMTALNLRLGLWLRHPASKSSQRFWLPGWRRLKEMFNWTYVGEESGDVHLSDGGHFENLGLYELVRRHCRYIIVSDGSRDPDVQFEDFGNAVRRIRTDFGVDIDIDLTPLKPGSDGLSRQHMAVGTICYDASGRDDDVGIILYFKPSLTGDEPCDVANYKRLNPKFPHETTGDQFYDEAQWESYRRLGYHAGYESLAFLERLPNKTTPPSEGEPRIPAWVQRTFTRARDTWFATTAGFDDTAAVLRQELARLELVLAEPVHQTLAAEIYPEFTPAVPPAQRSGPLSPEAMRQTVPLLIQMVQLIEQVYTACDLDRNFNHPHVLIWMNTFHRWCQAPTFRRAWSTLSPLVEPAARTFAEDRFGLPTLESGQLTFEPQFHATPDTLSAAATAALATAAATLDQPSRPPNWCKYVSLRLHVCGLSEPFSVEVGVWRLWRQEGETWRWADNEFVIYKGYWGAGLGGAFLRECLKKGSVLRREAPAAKHLEVLLRRDPRGPRGTRDIGHRRERNDLVLFYKALGFQADQDEDTGAEVILRVSLAS